MKYTTRTTCRVCGSSNLTPLFSLGNQHVSDFVAKDKVYSGPRCPIDIELCGNCTLVQAKHTAPQDFLYSRHYWYRSGVTETMRAALKDVVSSAVKHTALEPEDIVLDIGSNDGTLLTQYPRELTRVGVEPADNLVKYYHGEPNNKHLILINDFWTYQNYIKAMKEWNCGGSEELFQAKIITAIGMFYDLEDPNQFIADVAKVLHPEGVFVAQLMCLKQTIENYDIGNFAHEHLEFYSLRSLMYLMSKHNLTIFDVEENSVNGGSYRLYVRHAGAKLGDKAGLDRVEATLAWEEHVGLSTGSYLDGYPSFASFATKLGVIHRNLHGFISDEATKGKRTWVYGASTKGNVILQWAGLDDRLIHGAADRSPEKWGKFTAGTNIPIVSEASARSVLPDYFLVLPYSFLPEFVEREKDEFWRKRGGKFIVPLPEFKVV